MEGQEETEIELAEAIRREEEALMKEREWFRGQLGVQLTTTLARLKAAQEAIGRGAQERPQDMVLPAVAAVRAEETPKKAALSVDDILAQARGGPAPKRDEGAGAGGGGAGGTPPAVSAKKKKRRETENDDGSEKMMSFKSPDASFQGFVVLHGWHLTEAELTIQFQHHHRNASNGTYDVEIHSSRPWRLAQLQNAHLHIEEAIECLQAQDESKLSVALDSLVQAQEELIFPQTRSFPADARVFHPRLPADVLVDFCIVNQELVGQAVLVRPMAGGAASKEVQVTPLSLAQLKKLGDHFWLRDKMVEVLELSKVTCALPALNQCYKLLAKAINDLNAAIHNFDSLI